MRAVQLRDRKNMEMRWPRTGGLLRKFREYAREISVSGNAKRKRRSFSDEFKHSAVGLIVKQSYSFRAAADAVDVDVTTLRERPNRRRAVDLLTFGITPSRNRLECRHNRTVPVRLSIASAESVVATRSQLLDWHIYRSSPLVIAMLTPGYARLARQASAHPGLQSFATSRLSEPGFAWRWPGLSRQLRDGFGALRA